MSKFKKVTPTTYKSIHLIQAQSIIDKKESLKNAIKKCKKAGICPICGNKLETTHVIKVDEEWDEVTCSKDITHIAFKRNFIDYYGFDD